MKIAVVAGNGKAAKRIITEALSRGHQVTAFGRGTENRSGAPAYVSKDILKLTHDDLAGFDAVVDCFGVWKDDDQHLHTDTSQHLCDVLSGTAVRLLIVGGAGSLYTDAAHTKRLFDSPDFPPAYVPVSAAQGQALDALRRRQDVNWTFVSPAADFQPDGECSGRYILAGEDLTLNSKGESIISYADYAVAMLDEIESTRPHLKQRISVVRA